MKYSQHNEQEIILNFFNGRVGRYLDIGAFDGVDMSNTLALAELGWQGTAIEASPWDFKRLKNNYEQRQLTSSIKLIEAAAVPDNYPDQIKFYETHKSHNLEPGTGVGSFSKEHSHSWADKNKLEFYTEVVETTVSTITLKEIFKEVDYNFISIDVEDFNLELMVGIPWQLLTKLEMFCIEKDVAPYRFVNFMKPLGWKLYIQEDVNLFFVRS
jgi:FkbM family methyltransferase